MKFLSSIVQHSLQLSKKPNTSGFPTNPTGSVTSQINQQNNKQSLNQTDLQVPTSTKIVVINNEKLAAIKQRTQKLTDSSDGFEKNKNEQLSSTSSFTDKVKIEANTNTKKTINETLETSNDLRDVEQFKSKSIIEKKTEKKTEKKAENHENIVSRKTQPQEPQEPQIQQIQQKPTSTTKPKEAPQASRETRQQAITTQKQQEQQEQSNKDSYSEAFKNSPQETIKIKKQAVNNYYITRQKPVKPPLLQTIKQTKKVQQTPQVRIGQINVLIEDTAKSTPKPKSTTTTKTSSPFGLRGL